MNQERRYTAADLIDHFVRTLDGTCIDHLRTIVEVDQQGNGQILMSLRGHDPLTDTISSHRQRYRITVEEMP